MMSKSLFSWFVWFVVSIFYAYQYIVRVLPNIIMPDVMNKFQLNAALFGQFSGIYYLSYALMHIPLGILLDRYSPKKILSFSIVLTAIGLLPLIYSNTWFLPLFGRLLVGCGSSAAILGVFKIIRIFFPEDHFTRMLGLSVTIGLCGAIYGGEPLEYLKQEKGWEFLVHALFFAGIALAFLTYLLVPNHSAQELDKKNAIMADIFQVLTHKKVVLVCVLGGLMVGPLEGFADVWGKEFFKAVYNFSDNVSARLPSLTFLGMCFGASVLSYIADKTKAYYPIVILSAFIMGISFVFILLKVFSETYLSFLLVLVGVLSAYQIPVIYKASCYVEESKMGLCTSCANMIIMLFGYVFHSSIGILMDMKSQVNNVYKAEDYIFSISVIPLALFFAACGFYLIYKGEQQKT